MSSDVLRALVQVVLGLPAAFGYLVGFLAGQRMDLTSLCASDPPAFPVFGFQDTVDITTGNAVSNPSAFAKLATLAQIAAWYANCECVNAPAPLPPPPIAYPPGGTQFNFPGEPQLPVVPCVQRTDSFLNGRNATTLIPNDNVNCRLMPNGCDVIPGQSRLPPGWSNMVIGASGVGTGPPIQLLAEFFSSVSGPLGSRLIIIGPTRQTTSPLPAQLAADSIRIGVSEQPGIISSSLWQVTVDLTFYCGGTGQAPGVGITPCCPPDPVVAAQLSYMRGLLENIFSALPTNVRHYAEATVHAGLKGGGTITLQQPPLAVKVIITTDNNTLGMSPGDPTYLWKRGYIVPLAAEGPIRQESRIVYNPQVFLLPSTTDQVGFYAAPGVTISIIELVKGP